MPPPQRAKPARKSVRCGVGEGSPRPHPPHPQPVGSGPRPHARTEERSGPGRPPVLGRSRPRQEAPPQGALVPPPQHAKRARKSARYRVGEGSPRPHPPQPQPVGSGPRPHARIDEWSGVGERPTPDAPHPGRRRPPRAPSCRPHSAQSRLARARAVGLVTGPHARTHPMGSTQPQARYGETGPGRPPPKHAKQSTGLRPDTRRGTDQVERPYQRPAPGPREVRAPHQLGEGRGRGRRESASAHTTKGHAGKTRAATGPSPQNAQTAWNGLPASEDKGQPDGMARHTQRRKRGAGRGERGRHNTRHRLQPPRPGRERRTQRTRALHLPSQ